MELGNGLLATLQKLNFAKTSGTVTRDRRGGGGGVKLDNKRKRFGSSSLVVSKVVNECFQI